ncbi:MAG: sensor histidine kinase [Hyphomicrobiales bacterium]
MSHLLPMRRAATFVSLATLAFSLWAAIGLTRLSSLPPDFPNNHVVYPAHLDTLTVGSRAELRFHAQSRPIGSVLEVRSAAGVHSGRLVPQLTRVHFALILFEGIVFFAVNLLVFLPRLDRGPVRDFYWCTLLYGAAILINGVYLPRGPGVVAALPSLAWLACLTALPVFFFHMTLTFPRRVAILDARRWMVPALAGAAAALFAWQAFALERYVAAPAPGAWVAWRGARTIAEGYLVALVAVGCFVLYRCGRRLELAREREQATWLLWGFMVGVTPYVFLRTLPALLGLRSPLPPEADRLLELAIPLAFTLAVVRYRFLDIDIIVRRSLLYGFLAGALAAVYLVVGVVVANRVIARAPHYAETIRIVAVAVPVALFWPTRRWIGRWVDRTFFKIQYDFARALGPLAERLHGAVSRGEIATVCLSFLERTLLLRNGAVVTVGRSGPDVVGDLGEEAARAAYGALEELALPTTRLVAAAHATSRPDLETAEFPAALRGAGVRLACPLAAEGRFLGALLIGDKATERRFIEDELDLIERVRAEATEALVRVGLFQLAAEATAEREKAEAVKRMREDLFSRVAHDLRTPVTSIRYTVRNLIDGIGGEPAEGQRPGLRTIHAATTQLGRLIENLLDWSRTERGGGAPLEAVALEPLIRDLLALLGPLARERLVRLEFTSEPGLPPVRGDVTGLHGIVANLVENAIRFSPDGAAVEISLRRAAPGHQELLVRDHGPGIPEGDLEAIFEPFRQSARSPHSSKGGFGIGLHVVRSDAARMGGSAAAENHPEGGARFRCVFREWAAS